MSKNIIRITVLGLLTFFATSVIFAADENPAEKNTEKKWYEKIEVNGMLRLRPEVKVNSGFETGRKHDSEFVGQKLWLSLAAQPSKDLKFVFTLQDSRDWGAEQGAVTGLSTAFLNTGFREAYFKVGLLPDERLSLIGGRQKIAFGDQRLFGALEWSNIGRSFDAVRINWNEKINNFSIWSSVLQEGNSAYAIAQTPNLPEMMYNGVYNTTKVGEVLLVDVYYANKLNVTDSYTLKHHTAGARITNTNDKNSPFDFTAEGAYQFGTKNDMDVSAYAAALHLGFTINSGIKIRFGLEGDIASGDTDSTDNKVETFDNLFPTNHAHYGMADVISWQNMIGASGNISASFSEKLTVILAYWYFQRVEDTDSWYGVAGGSSANDSWITGASGISDLTELGHEIDLTVKSKLHRNFELEAGYAIVVPGGAVQSAGKNDPYHFTYISAAGKF